MPRRKKKSVSATNAAMGPRVATHLPVDPQGLYTHCTASWAAIKADPAHFPSPYPPAAQVDEHLQALGLALTAAESGGPVETAALYAAAGKVREDFTMLGKYVQSSVRNGAVQDASVILANVLMYESKVGKRSPKPELQAKDGPGSGEVLLIALAVASALVYTWEWSLDQQSWTMAAQTGRANTLVAGLTPGKVYYFRFRVFKRDETTTSNSQVVSFMVR
jgi:hypothetical protein